MVKSNINPFFSRLCVVKMDNKIMVKSNPPYPLFFGILVKMYEKNNGKK